MNRVPMSHCSVPQQPRGLLLEPSERFHPPTTHQQASPLSPYHVLRWSSTGPQPIPRADATRINDTSTTGIDMNQAERPHPSLSRRESTQSQPDGDGEVHFTKTGRVSRAKKGQRVHTCDECGRVYTRNEHMVRHKQNHKPGEFRCDLAGCSRSFHREDLLLRHKLRHNERLPLGNPSPPESLSGRTPGPEYHEYSRRTSVPVQHHVQDITVRLQSLAEIGTHIPQDYQRSANAPSNTLYERMERSGGVATEASTTLPEDSSSIAIKYQQSTQPPSLTASSIRGGAAETAYLQHYQPAMSPNSDVTATRLISPRDSHSPVSAISSASSVHQPSWSAPTAGPPPFTLSRDIGATVLPRFQDVQTTSRTAREPLQSGVYSMVFPFGEGDLSETHMPFPPSLRGGSAVPSSYPIEQRCLDSYFKHIHPFYPVVHQASIANIETQALLRIAILALGGQALPEKADKVNAHSMHERCVKALDARKSEKPQSDYRTSDLQAILLVEVYAIFCSRRPFPSLSQAFQDAFRYISNNQQDMMAKDLMAPTAQAAGQASEQMWIESQSRQRTAMAFYVLEQQHSILLCRPPLSATCLPAIDLLIPTSSVSWDAVDNPGKISRQQHIRNVLDIIWSSKSNEYEYDFFQSAAIMFSIMDNYPYGAVYRAYEIENSNLPGFFAKHTLTDMAFCAFMLCKHTPVRSILGVAGESWVLAEKLSSQSEYAQAQNEVYAWANGDGASDVQRALKYALRILEIYHSDSGTGLLFLEWAVHLAAVVVWARAYATTTVPYREPQQIPSRPSAPQQSELHQSLLQVFRGGPAAPIALHQALDIVLWAKMKLKALDLPCAHGLIDSALQILSNLAARGDEAGWFSAYVSLRSGHTG